MATRCAIRPGAYFDSVVLMRVAAEIGDLPGVRIASLVMATPANKAVLADAGLLTPDAQAAGPSDLVIAVDGDDEALDSAIAAADEALSARGAPSGDDGPNPIRPRSLAQVDAGLALISTPGRYAAAEAMKALRRGMSVFMFSDNVPVEQECELKREAHARGLLVMGPDCGTALVDGVPLGFANNVRRGNIALVGASGTGLQQVSTLIHRWGGGVSQIVGVGSRDLSAEVGGISMIDTLDALSSDPDTGVIVLVSKPPHPRVAAQVLERSEAVGKPVVAAFLGGERLGARGEVEVVSTLEDAARAALVAAGGSPPEVSSAVSTDRPSHNGGRRLLRALYAGGTFAYEAKALLGPRIALAADGAMPAGARREPELPGEHLVLDLGADEFTVGRPHPMIDPAVRLEMLRAAGADPRTLVIVLDIVLGHGAAADPAGDLAPLISSIAAGDDAPEIVAFVVGTDADPQGLERQEATLRDAGARLAASSTDAARLVTGILALEEAVL